MIASLRGTIIAKSLDTVVIEASGVGYEVWLTAGDLGKFKIGTEGQVMIHEVIREDAHTLYGFTSAATRQFFGQLLTISGIGPKVALAILQAAPIERLKQAIAAGDPDLLRGVSGVGPKTAQRLVIELRGRVDAAPTGAVSSGDSVYQALIGLGYAAPQAAEAIAGLSPNVRGDQARLKAALRSLAK